MKYKLIIFDLDGTLLDTSSGIFNSVRYAEQQMGFKSVNHERLREFVGPPPKDTYMKVYGVSEEVAIRATSYHREYSRKKAYKEAELYPEVEQTLATLKDNQYKLAVATLKTQEIAEKVLDVFGVSKYFDTVMGMDKDEKITKSEMISNLVEMYGDASTTLMVGDSQFDLDGSKKVGVDFLSAIYGFGFDEVVSDSCSVGSITTFSELLKYV